MMDSTASLHEITRNHQALLQSIVLDDNNNIINQDRSSNFIYWLDCNYEGFYVRDLDLVCEVIDILIQFLSLDYINYEAIVERFLELCSLPLMELKANERLSPQGFDRIKRFYSKMSTLWDASLNAMKIKIGKCFRCIVNGGKDPTLLRSQHREWLPDGVRLRITDVGFIEKALRESSALQTIVYEYLRVCEELNYKSASAPNSPDERGVEPVAEDEYSIPSNEEMVKSSDDFSSQIDNNVDDDQPVQLPTEFDDPEFYGVPREFLQARRAAQAAAVEALTNEEQNYAKNSNSPLDIESAAVDKNLITDEGKEATEIGNAEAAESDNVPTEETVEENTAVVEKAGNETADQNTDNAPAEGDNSAATESAEIDEEKDAAEEDAADGQILCEEMGATEGDHNGVNSSSVSDNAAIVEENPVQSDDALEENNDLPVDESAHDNAQPTSPDSNFHRSRSQGSIGTSAIPDDSPVILRDLSQVLLDLCLELSRDATSAVMMCLQGVCFGAVVMVEKDFNLNPRDHRVSLGIELMWNVLENLLEHTKQAVGSSSSPDEVRARLSECADSVVEFRMAIRVLQSVLVYALNEGFRLSDKELRNEALIILTLLAHFPNALGCFIDQGLFHLLITYACIEEMGTESWDGFISNLAKQRNYATPSDVDFEFKKGLWFIISELLRGDDKEAVEVFASSPLQACMLKYMECDSFGENGSTVQKKMGSGTDPHGGSMEGGASGLQLAASTSLNNMSRFEDNRGGNVLMSKTYTHNDRGNNNQLGSPGDRMNASMPSFAAGAAPPMASATFSAESCTTGTKKTLISLMPLSKLREFQVLAATFLLHNSPRKLPTFESIDGPSRVVTITLRYCQSDIADHKALIFNALILLQRCLVQSQSVRQFMEETGLMETYLLVYHKSEHDETRAQALSLVGTLCSDDNMHCQRLFSHLGGVADLLEPLQSYVRNRPPLAGLKAGVKIVSVGDNMPDPFENPYGGEISVLVIAIIDCLSKSVVGNRTNELQFADAEGLDVLLDLMETSPTVLRLQVLRLLSDIMKNPKMVTYVNAWRSAKTLRSAPQILCHCWMDEEVRLVGERRRNGIIRDVWHPLSKEDPAMYLDDDADLNMSIDSESQLSPSSAPPYEESVFARDMPGVQTGSPTSGSLTVTKLANAILAGRNANQTNLPIDILSKALERDARVLIADILLSAGVLDTQGSKVSGDSVPVEEVKGEVSDSLHISTSVADQQQLSLPSPSFGDQANDRTEGEGTIGLTGALQSSSDLGLNPRDRQIVAMAKKYAALREGEWWQAVRDYCAETDVTPIEADQALMDSRLENSCTAAEVVRVEQISLFDDDQRLKREDEDNFVDQILTRKNQQIKAEWLKTKGKGKLVKR